MFSRESEGLGVRRQGLEQILSLTELSVSSEVKEVEIYKKQEAGVGPYEICQGLGLLAGACQN